MVTPLRNAGNIHTLHFIAVDAGKPPNTMDIVMHLVGKGMLQEVNATTRDRLGNARPSPCMLRERAADGTPLVPFIVLRGVNSTFHNTINVNGRLSLSISTSPRVTARVDELMVTFKNGGVPVVLAVFLSGRAFLGHVQLSHRRKTAMFWRLQMQKLTDECPRVRTAREMREAIDARACVLLDIKQVLTPEL